MTDFDWSRYRKCPVCFAGLGKPCRRRTGFDANGPISVPNGRPHGGRELRAGAVSR